MASEKLKTLDLSDLFQTVIGRDCMSLMPQPINEMTYYFNTHVLCLPFFGPWEGGTFTDAMSLSLKLKPKFIIPIHDYHYKPEFRDAFYERAQGVADSFGGHLICQQDGEPNINLSLN